MPHSLFGRRSMGQCQKGRGGVCRPYGAHNPCRRWAFPGLPSWALLSRAYGAGADGSVGFTISRLRRRLDCRAAR